MTDEHAGTNARRVRDVEQLVTLRGRRLDRVERNVTDRRRDVEAARATLADARERLDGAVQDRSIAEDHLVAVPPRPGCTLSARAFRDHRERLRHVEGIIARATVETERCRGDLNAAEVRLGEARTELSRARRDHRHWCDVRDDVRTRHERARDLSEEVAGEDESADRFGASLAGGGA